MQSTQKLGVFAMLCAPASVCA